MPVGVHLTIVARPDTADELRERLTQAVALSRTEPGNLMAVLMADPADSHRFAIFEIYRDEEAMEAHRNAPYAKQAAPIIHALFAEPMTMVRLDTLNWPESLTVDYAEAGQ